MRHFRLPVAALAAFAFAACGGRNPSTTEITYNCAANATEIRQLEAETPAFAETTGITIKLQPFTGQEKLYAMMAADQAPDIFYTNTVIRDRLAAEGRLLDMRAVDARNPFTRRLLDDVVMDGFAADSGLYSIGNWSFTVGVYYNRDLFDASGIAYPDTSWTWDDLKRIARRLSKDVDGDGRNDRFGVFIGSHFVEVLELMNGAPLMRRSLFLDLSPASLEAYGEYLGLMKEGLMPDLRRIQAMGMQAMQLLQNGTVGMLVEAVPHQALVETLTMRWGIAPIPRFPGKPIRYFRSGSGGLSISARSKNPEAAWKALTWIVAGASAYQPNPVLRDADFAGGWERRYPQLVGSGYRAVWDRSLRYPGGDPRLFVRFSSWSSATILERLQPILDRVWVGELPLGEIPAEVPAINDAVRREVDRLLRRNDIGEGFMREVRSQYEEAGRGSELQAN